MYVILEGIDTAGKSTQIELLKQEYKNAVFTKEPGGTNVGKTIRSLVLENDIKSSVCEMFLFLADRAEHYKRVVEPNDFVISDRGLVSGIAYAMQNFDDLEMLGNLNKLCLDGKLPDKVILLSLDKDELNTRLSKKSHDKIELRGIEYLLSIQENMIKVLEFLGIDYVVIDAKRSVEGIFDEIKSFIDKS
ncbi:MAG: Thymidylate kinase (EC [uncultured Campylobacterales bacterium]|uniref:Thymidylate kinase n=1 Tax=uncultured Campylobacterales bacterium TaxID=352960 RepID=A0A6S6SZ75_9BACT|nr:MAG: Thymidylate kinase (EC [uncultured Campylobacterales bacterium]